MRSERRGDFSGSFQGIQRDQNYFHECKWTKANGRVFYPFAEQLVDYFFRREWLAFHCIVVEKAKVNMDHHKNFDEARRKHFTMLLDRKIKALLKRHSDRDHTFQIWVDPIASSYQKADEVVEVILRNQAKKLAHKHQVEIKVSTRDSQEALAIQLCDLLLGAVMETWQKKASSGNKTKLRRHIASHLGWTDLDTDTFMKERKFNIWKFWEPKMGPRVDTTRPVNLKFPLPG